jgi:AraC-like DNA-binding protein
MNSKLNHVKNWPELARHSNWCAAALAKLCGVSANTLRRHFLQHTRKTPGAWLAEQRQHQAIKILQDGSPIKETAMRLGYKHQTNFTRKFKEFWGTCPSLQSPAHLNKTQMAKND